MRRSLLTRLFILLGGVCAFAQLGARDPYEALGVPRSASFDALQTAHRALARRFHPDKCGTASCRQTFLDLQAAYVIVSDPVRRAVYDAHGHSGLDRLEEKRRQSEWRNSVRSGGASADEEQPESSGGVGDSDARVVGAVQSVAAALRSDPWPLATLALAIFAMRALRRHPSQTRSSHAPPAAPRSGADPQMEHGPVVNATEAAPAASRGQSSRAVIMPQSVSQLTTSSSASLFTNPGVYVLLLLIPARPPPPPRQPPPSGMQKHASLRRYGSAVAAARSVMASLATAFADEPKLAFFVLDSEQHPAWRAFAAAEATACGGLPLIAWRPGTSRRRYCRIMGGVSRSTHGPDVAAIARQRVELLLTGGVPGERWLEGAWQEMA
jgi:curved DNA-binding protein CbpA